MYRLSLSSVIIFVLIFHKAYILCWLEFLNLWTPSLILLTVAKEGKRIILSPLNWFGERSFDYICFYLFLSSLFCSIMCWIFCSISQSYSSFILSLGIPQWEYDELVIYCYFDYSWSFCLFINLRNSIPRSSGELVRVLIWTVFNL